MIAIDEDEALFIFRSSDFDRNYGWYDVIGAVAAGREYGTFALARPDGGQVTLTFRADSRRCRFDGFASFIPEG